MSFGHMTAHVKLICLCWQTLLSNPVGSRASAKDETDFWVSGEKSMTYKTWELWLILVWGILNLHGLLACTCFHVSW